MMKKYKIRIFGLGIDAKALIPFPYEPTIEMIENAVAEYLNEGLMKIEVDDFFAKNKLKINYQFDDDNEEGYDYFLELTKEKNKWYLMR